MTKTAEVFISVDVETSGPIPGKYSLLQIGACKVDAENEDSFSIFLKPISRAYVLEALEITGLNLDDLEIRGVEGSGAMKAFARWISVAAGESGKPVFVGLNAAFDWSFINYYFHTFLGNNPFRYSALDIKSLFVGLTGGAWAESTANDIAAYFGIAGHGNHDALCDARFQAKLFSAIWTSTRS
jgi:DNA polymerase III epsilon subunit-like protein